MVTAWTACLSHPSTTCQSPGQAPVGAAQKRAPETGGSVRKSGIRNMAMSPNTVTQHMGRHTNIQNRPDVMTTTKIITRRDGMMILITSPQIDLKVEIMLLTRLQKVATPQMTPIK